MMKPKPKAEVVIEHRYNNTCRIYPATEAASELIREHASGFGTLTGYGRDSYWTLEISSVYSHREVKRYLLEVCTGQLVTVEPPRIAEASTQSILERLTSLLIRVFPVRKEARVNMGETGDEEN